MARTSSLFSILITVVACNGLSAFQTATLPIGTWPSRNQCNYNGPTERFAVFAARMTATSRVYAEEEKPNHFLLEEFCTHSGEVVNPYEILKVSRKAKRQEVRKAYVTLSKRYHPDGVRHQDVLPGKCNDLDDVREEWERIKLSYEILSDKKTRQRYDRHAMIADPQGAMSRAAIDAVGKGITGLGQGLFNVGVFAVRQMTNNRNSE